MTRSSRLTPHVILAVATLILAGACTRSLGQTGAGEEVIATGTPSEFLVCAQPPASVQAVVATIGRAGGTLRTGGTELVIPAGALQQDVEFVIRPDTTQRTGVWIEGREPVRFTPGLSATLTIDISHCRPDELGDSDWSIWRMGVGQNESQRLRTFRDARRARARIDSTSGFLIAN